jgi:antitoxin StbD
LHKNVPRFFKKVFLREQVQNDTTHSITHHLTVHADCLGTSSQHRIPTSATIGTTIGSKFGANLWKQFILMSRSACPNSKKNPAAVLRDAKSKPVAVLNHNKAAFYMVEPALFEALLEELSDQELHRTVLSRMGERSRAIEVDIDAI